MLGLGIDFWRATLGGPRGGFRGRPGTAGLLLTGFAPSVILSGGFSVSPGVGQLALDASAPQVALGATARPGVAELELAGPAPTVPLGGDPPQDGLVAWFRADTGVTDAGGGRVSAWADMSGNGFDLAQATSGQQPLLVADVVNGKPVIRFVLSRVDRLARATTPTDTQPYSLAAAVARTGDSVLQWFWGGNNGFRTLGFTSSNEPGLFAGSFPDNNTPIDTGFHTFVGNFNGASSEIIIDGGTPATVDAGTGNLDGGLVVGSGPGGSDPFSGDVAELLVFDHALDVDELAALAAYFSARYGIGS